jgi:hypothetical protein
VGPKGSTRWCMLQIGHARMWQSEQSWTVVGGIRAGRRLVPIYQNTLTARMLVNIYSALILCLAQIASARIVARGLQDPAVATVSIVTVTITQTVCNGAPACECANKHPLTSSEHSPAQLELVSCRTR